MRSSKAIWRLRSASVLAAAAVVLATPASAQRPATTDHWVATWGTAQQFYQATPGPVVTVPPPSSAAATPAPTPPPGTPARRFPIPPRVNSLNDQTVRMIARASIGGRSVRIRLSNAVGGHYVRIGKAHIALREKGSAIAAGSDRVATFSGAESAT